MRQPQFQIVFSVAVSSDTSVHKRERKKKNTSFVDESNLIFNVKIYKQDDHLNVHE